MSTQLTSSPSGNQTLSKARSAKQDEFYTQLSDIENELKHYRAQMRDKIVLCNCDDPYESNFFRYFALNFNALGLKKLIATSYPGSAIAGGYLPLLDIEGLKPEGKEPYAIEINEVLDHNGDGATDLADVEYLLRNDANTCRTLNGDADYGAGDFRSRECIEYLKQADIVVTNPPFSLFREYVAQLVEYEKRFLIIGSQSAITYRDIFRLIKANEVWLGVNNGGTKWFRVPDEYDIQTESRKKIVGGTKYFSMGSVMWFTNIDNPKRHEMLPIYRAFRASEYPCFDNYDAIEVGRTSDIPEDYDGVMGVPITFLDKYNPRQFEVIGLAAGNIKGLAGIPSKTGKDGPYMNGKLKYGRILIRRKR